MKKTNLLNYFLPFAIIICVQILIVWILGFYYITDSIEKRNAKDYLSAVENLQLELQSCLQTSNLFAKNIEQTSFVKKMASDYYDINWFELIEYKYTLDASVGINNKVSNAFILFNNKDVVLSNFSLVENKNNFFQYTFNINESIDETKSILNLQNYYSNIIFAKANCGQDSGYAIVASYPYMNFDYDNIIVTITYLDTIIRKIINQFPENTNVILQNKNQKPIFFTNNDQFNLVDDNLDEIYNQIKYEPNYIKYNSQKYYSMKFDVGYGITCTLITENAQFVNNIKNIQVTMICILIASLLIGFFMIYKVSIVRSKPIVSIYNNLRNRHNFTNNKININDIESQVCELIDKEKELSQSIQHVKPTLKNDYLSELINGKIEDDSSISLGLKLCDVDFIYDKYAVLIIDNNNKKNNIINFLHSNISKYQIKIYDIYDKEKFYNIVIMNFNSDKNLSEYIKELYEYINNINQYIEIGLGKTKTNILLLNESYKEALKQIQEKMVRQSGKSLCEDEEVLKTPYYLPDDKENSFINYLKLGEYENASSVLANIIHENIDIRKINVEALKSFYIHIIVVSFQSMHKENDSLNENTSIKKILDMTNHDEIINLLEIMLKEICKTNEDAKIYSKYSELILNVLSYLDKNYLDYNLNLSSTADTFNIHRVYLSSLFNKENSCSFVEYVNKKRVEHSKILLLRNDLRISDIYTMCGFNSEVTYRREFKKYNGISPSQYREYILNA